MKLYCSSNSPYARKVRIMALELGIRDQFEMLDTNPRDPANDLYDVNPLRKIPTMITSNGDVILDSPVICEYLNEVYGQGQFLPKQQDEVWNMRSLIALCHGVLDAGMSVRVENTRKPELQSEGWKKHQLATVQRGLAELEKQSEHFENEFNLLAIGLVSTLGWLYFRFDHIDWLETNPKMRAWYTKISERASVKATVPGELL
ncbi:glutathione S-transferase family protein [Orrella sp. 11846]|uniref:glutathione S-transferase family protein n=1 Tax=Orrella sp. 11846 TaxID=3409913 RepID=UPI003B5ABEE3